MTLANVVTYASFLDFPVHGVYCVRLTISQTEKPRPVQIDFLYEIPPK